MSLFNNIFSNEKSSKKKAATVSKSTPTPEQTIAAKNPKQPENSVPTPKPIKNSSPAPKSSENSSPTIPKHSEIYYPEHETIEPAEVEKIILTEKQAVEQGWSFRKKSKRIRITGYHGTEKDIIIPSQIGDMIVNEIGPKAFIRTKIDSVQIPSTIYKVREDAFIFSEIKSVTFAEGARSIANNAFYECKNLHEVHLADTLVAIGEYAFGYCRSLEYVIFPSRLRTIGECAFFGSGLSGFSTQVIFPFIDGSVFQSTLIHENYKLLVTNDVYNAIHVLLVGTTAVVKFPKGSRVHLMKNAVDSSCSLDFSDCSSIYFQDSYNDKRGKYGVRNFYIMDCKAIVPYNVKYLYFPDYVDVRYPDGSKYKGYINILKRDFKDTQIEVLSHKVHSWTINTHSENISFIDVNNYYSIGKYAINEPYMKTINLGFVYAADEIFSPFCKNLREVHYDENVSESVNITHITRFVPPKELVGSHIHQKFLTAFTLVPFKVSRKPPYKTKYSYFYDSTVIHDMFTKGYITYFDWRNKQHILKLNQRSKIFIAIDVLRSSVSPNDIDTKIYKDYLRTHKRYAEIICYKVADVYPEYGEYLYDMTF